MMSKVINSSLTDIFTCKVCNKYFKSPVTLPCGHNVCSEHVNLDNESYTCKECNKEHRTVERGFVSCTAIINLLKLNIHLAEETVAENKLIDQFDSVMHDFRLLSKARVKRF